LESRKAPLPIERLTATIWLKVVVGSTVSLELVPVTVKVPFTVSVIFPERVWTDPASMVRFPVQV